MRLVKLIARLHDVFNNSTAVLLWLTTPNSRLNYATPLDVWEEGRKKEVMGLVDALGEGVFV